MAAIRRYIDPATGDYVIAQGNPREDVTHASNVVLLLRTRRGTSPVAPEMGSRLFEIDRLTAQAEKLAAHYAVEALAPLERRGAIRNVKATAVARDTALEITVSYKDQSGEPRIVRYQKRIG